MNLPDEVLEDAHKAGDKALIEANRSGEIPPYVGLRAAAEVIADYAYRKGREDALEEARKRVADPTDPGDHAIHDAIYKAADVIKDTGGRFGEFGEEIPRVAKDAVEAFLTSLAGEKENDRPDTVTVELFREEAAALCRHESVTFAPGAALAARMAGMAKIKAVLSAEAWEPCQDTVTVTRGDAEMLVSPGSFPLGDVRKARDRFRAALFGTGGEVSDGE